MMQRGAHLGSSMHSEFLGVLLSCKFLKAQIFHIDQLIWYKDPVIFRTKILYSRVKLSIHRIRVYKIVGNL